MNDALAKQATAIEKDPRAAYATRERVLAPRLNHRGVPDLPRTWPTPEAPGQSGPVGGIDDIDGPR